MSSVNPQAIVLVAFCAVVGAVLGTPLIGLAVGLGLIVIASAL